MCNGMPATIPAECVRGMLAGGICVGPFRSLLQWGAQCTDGRYHVVGCAMRSAHGYRHERAGLLIIQLLSSAGFR